MVCADPLKSLRERLMNVSSSRRPVAFVGPVAVIWVALRMVASALSVLDEPLLVATANAQANPPEPIEKAKKAVETLINHLRGRDMPEGIVKTNGRIEATQVDVAAK